MIVFYTCPGYTLRFAQRLLEQVPVSHNPRISGHWWWVRQRVTVWSENKTSFFCSFLLLLFLYYAFIVFWDWDDKISKRKKKGCWRKRPYGWGWGGFIAKISCLVCTPFFSHNPSVLQSEPFGRCGRWQIGLVKGAACILNLQLNTLPNPASQSSSTSTACTSVFHTVIPLWLLFNIICSELYCWWEPHSVCVFVCVSIDGWVLLLWL